MGQNVVRPLLGGWENYPDINEVPSFDPMLGFPNGRKVREPGASLDEMRCANVPPAFRDYCAHKLIDYFVCQRKHFPMDYKRCHHEKHEYHSCIRDDYLIRMMEVERERRLRLRKKKKEAAQAEMITA